MQKLITTAIVFQLAMLSVMAEEAYQLTGKAWGALGSKNWDEVERLANRSANQWGEHARRQNNGLAKMPNTQEAKKLNSLNEVATITYLKGEALFKKGDREGALAAYYTLLADYNYGQIWDNGGWYWSPANAARERIAEIMPGSQKEVGIDTEPLSETLRLPGKKGICFTLRESGDGGANRNLPRIEATNSYWNYSWGSQRIAQQPEDLEFMPMTWGAWSNEGFAKDIAKNIKPQIEAGQAKRILGFNEPDKKEQANMPYQAALKYWPMLEELGLPLCSPACANPLSDIDESTQGVRGTWMRDFMREADKRNYRIDYIGVHWYGSTNARSFKERMVQVYEAYGRRPLLISEFAVADWNAKRPEDNQHQRADVLKFMKDVIPWMEKQNWIAGYCWFSFEDGDRNGTCSALFDKDEKLTALGRYYQSVTVENPDGDQSIK